MTTILAAVLGAAIFIFVAPASVPDLSAQAADAVSKYQSLSYFDHFISIIPNNLLQPFVAGNVLSILIVAASFGLGIAVMPESEKKKVF